MYLERNNVRRMPSKSVVEPDQVKAALTVVLAPKKDKVLRFSVDYRKRGTAEVPELYNHPWMYE